MEDETNTAPPLRSLCLDYIARIGTQGIDLLELGKSLPPDCFLDVLERLILWSKISLGLSFNVILALQDYDKKYFLPDTQLHVKCEDCGIIGEIEVCKPRLQAHLYECDLCHISLCKKCLISCDACQKRLCKRCVDDIKQEGLQEDPSIGDWCVRQIIFDNMYRPPVEAEGSIQRESSPFTCFSCLLDKHYKSILDENFAMCDGCSFLKNKSTLARCRECGVSICGRCTSWCDCCYNTMCFPCKHEIANCTHCYMLMCAPEITSRCKLCENPVCESCCDNVWLTKDTIPVCPECKSNFKICTNCDDLVKIDQFQICPICNAEYCPGCVKKCPTCSDELCPNCKHDVIQKCSHCEVTECVLEPLNCNECGSAICYSCSMTIWTRKDSMEICPECFETQKNKN